MSLYVKICGLTTPRQIEAALSAGADGIGLVLSPSPRQVSSALAKELLACIPTGVERIAVLNRPSPGLHRALRSLAWDGIQFNAAYPWELPADRIGPDCFLLPSYADSPELLQQLKRRTSLAVSQAMGSRPGRIAWSPRSLRGCFLLDGASGGGKGIGPDSFRAQAAARLGPMVLAGGLCPSTVGSAIARIRPFAVDVSSGVEASKGVKDPSLIRDFILAARDAANPLPYFNTRRS